MEIFIDKPLPWWVTLTDGARVDVVASSYSESGDSIDFEMIFRMAAAERRDLFIQVPPPDSDPERVAMVVASFPRASVSSVILAMAG